MEYKFILTNPYIVGNPIKSQNMFFGREEDFKVIKRKLNQETKGIIITLAGERRSGKTSILFQIMNGRLGNEFMPFFIDMQTMADVNRNVEFLMKIDDSFRKELEMPSREADFSGEGFNDFENTIINIQKCNSGKKIVLLFDEYELLEGKIEKGQISEDVFSFFANLMENHNVLFVFSGSKKITERNPKYWKSLLSKSIFRNISFLDPQDCIALITKPCEGYVNYQEEYVKIIFRLTAGQPFYTQIFCQNMVDLLQSERRNDVHKNDLAKVIQDIIDHPIPQMIYFWDELSRNQKIVLASMAEIIQSGYDYTDSNAVAKYLQDNKIGYLISLEEIKKTFTELVDLNILSKGRYQFRVDLFRYWIKQDQNIWKVLNDYKSELPKPSRPVFIKVVVTILLIVVLSTASFYIGPLLINLFWNDDSNLPKDKQSRGNESETGMKTNNPPKSSPEFDWWNKTKFYYSTNPGKSNSTIFLNKRASCIIPDLPKVNEEIPMLELNNDLLTKISQETDKDFFKILVEMKKYKTSGDTNKVFLNNTYKDNPQGFIVYLFSKVFNLQTNDSIRISNLQLRNWLKENFYLTDLSKGKENDYKNGYIIFYMVNGTMEPMFFLKNNQQKYVIGMTSGGIKIIKYDPAKNAGGVCINYWWRQSSPK